MITLYMHPLRFFMQNCQGENSEIIFLVCFYCRRSGGDQVLELHLPRAFLADHLRDPLQRHCLFGQGKRPEFTLLYPSLCCC